MLRPEWINAHADLMSLIDSDPQPINQDQTAHIKAAILHDGKSHGGHINPNRVRDLLRHATVFHKRIGPAYSSLKAAGLITKGDVPIKSNDHEGGNAGRWIDTYELTDAGWAA